MSEQRDRRRHFTDLWGGGGAAHTEAKERDKATIFVKSMVPERGFKRKEILGENGEVPPKLFERYRIAASPGRAKDGDHGERDTCDVAPEACFASELPRGSTTTLHKVGLGEVGKLPPVTDKHWA